MVVWNNNNYRLVIRNYDDQGLIVIDYGFGLWRLVVGNSGDQELAVGNNVSWAAITSAGNSLTFDQKCSIWH